ncbi:MAG: DUF4097 domain-containing protein [Planctomycetes bacterium]|nr:DUF4097 domain-containing protein [Planctomycetota bacterium]
MNPIPHFVRTVALATLSLAACNANWSVHPFTANEAVTQSFTTTVPTRVVAEMFNGSIEVITGTDATIKIDVDKRGGGDTQAAAQEDLKNVSVTMTQTGDTVSVIAKRTDARVDIGNSGASASLRVPAGTVLELHSGNGKVVVSGPVGKSKAVTSNGGIEVKGAAGPLSLTTSNGSITVNGGSGQLTLETSNGAINITADNVDVSARSSNGAINFKGSLAAGEQTFRTGNSSIKLTLPEGAAFSFDAQTSNGKINSDFKVTASGNFNDTSLQGTVGENPQAKIVLHTSNGNISLKQSK